MLALPILKVVIWPFLIFIKMKNGLKIRKFQKKDALKILELINFYASAGFMLPKTSGQIFQMEYLVAENEAEIIGGVGLKKWSGDLAEIVSLVVSQGYSGHGIGTILVKEIMKEAKGKGYKKIFTLTLRPNIFKRLGMEESMIKSFPEKIWSDCRNCPKMPAAPQIPNAMKLLL